MWISALWMFPLKGAAGIPLDAARLDGFGLADDRRWMIVADTGAFVTQRDHPQLALLRTRIDGDALVLDSDVAGSTRVPRGGGVATRVRVWADDVDAADCGDGAAALVSQHLGLPARIVYMPAASVRAVDRDFGAPGDRVSFADGFPLLLIGQGSLDALNARLAAPLPMLRFRPNIVVADAAPHAEDAWRRIRLGNIICDVVKPCARCAVTTIDPATGRAGDEPLRTLADYRRWNGKVWFGQNVIHRAQGTIRVGDRVSVLASAEPRPPLALSRGP